MNSYRYLWGRGWAGLFQKSKNNVSENSKIRMRYVRGQSGTDLVKALMSLGQSGKWDCINSFQLAHRGL